MKLFRQTNSFLGVDLGAGGVKIVELKKEKNRPVLFTYGLTSGSQDVHRLLQRAEPENGNLIDQPAGRGPDQAPSQFKVNEQQVDSYAAALQAVVRQSRAVSRLAVASAPVSAVFHAIVTLPRTPPAERQTVLDAEVRKLLPYPLEEMSVESEVLPSLSDGRTERLLVNAVPRALVSFYTLAFQKAGLKLDSLEPESTALARALVGRDQAISMLLDLGAERTNFFIIDQGVPLTHHSIELGGERLNALLARELGVEAGQVEQLKKDLFRQLMIARGEAILSQQEFLGIVMPALEPIVKEISFSQDLFLRQSGNTGKRLERIVLTGGAANFPYLAEHLAQTFQLKCYLGDPWGRVVYQDSLRPLLDELGPRLAVAIGLALRNVV